jgi:hypothetical protein
MKELAWHVTISEADCSNGPCTKAACPLNTNQKNICIQTIWLVHGIILINSDMIPHLGNSQYRALISFIYLRPFQRRAVENEARTARTQAKTIRIPSCDSL